MLLRNSLTSPPQAVSRRVYYAILIMMVVMVGYLGVRVSMLAGAAHSTSTAVIAVVLFIAELFIAFHAVGYFWNVARALRHRPDPVLFEAVALTAVPVAVLVTTYNEAEEVIEETLASVRAMDYPAVRLYLVDDSTKEQSQGVARRLASKYGARLVHRTNRAGYKAGAINDLLPQLDEPYIAVLDSDQRPICSWLKHVIPILERQPRLAMVQAPQVYVNTEGLRVAEAAAYQQAVFFEYICEGKSAVNAVFCCGSNVVLRREALISIGQVVEGRHHFFDETSVTEDFATSVRLHMKGWETLYVNEPFVVGMGPETLAVYFTQQMRWSMGTLGVGLRVFGQLLRHPRALRPVQWWEYLVSGTYYFIGIVNLLFILLPVLFLLVNVAPLQGAWIFYLAFFVPYFVFSMSLFLVGMKLRGHPIRGVWLASALSFCTSWVYLKASLVAILGLKRAFGVTPKAVGGSIPLRGLLPVLVLFIVSSAAAVVGALRLWLVGVESAYVVTTMWAAYHAVLLSTLFEYFNRPVTIAAAQPLFEPVRQP